MSPSELPVPIPAYTTGFPWEETLPSFLGSLHCVYLPVLSRYRDLEDGDGSCSSFSTNAETLSPLILQLL